MTTDKDRGRTRRFVRWLKDKVENRRGRDAEHDPWWVTLMLDVGRPAVAVLILAMCAPGEHFIAVESGLNEKLAWGMPGTLTAYAGIAAVVATKRPKDAPGRKTAVAGAVMAVLLAMAAQPVAHLWGRFGQPSQAQEIWLTIVAGMIPAAVFGHLLHLGAASAPRPSRTSVQEDKTVKVSKPDRKRADKTAVRVPVVSDMSAPDSPPDTKPKWLSDNERTAAEAGLSVSELMSAPDSPPDAMSWTASDTEAVPQPVTADTDTSVTRTPRRMSNGSMRSFALSEMTDNPSVTDGVLTDRIRDKFGSDTKPNSIYVAIKRARLDWRQTA